MITELQLKKLIPFIEAIGNKFKNGLKILDYGYGKGILLEYLRNNLIDFNYYGFEVSNSTNIKKIKEEKNVKISIGNKSLLSDFIEKSDIIFLRSIFTHLKFNKFEAICNKFKNKYIIFSVFIDEEYHVEGKKLYNLDDCYRFVFYTEDMIKKYTKNNNLILEYKSKFYVPHVDLYQTIYVMYNE